LIYIMEQPSLLVRSCLRTLGSHALRHLFPAALILIALSACGNGGDKDQIADRIEKNADNRADSMEQASEAMTNALQQNVTEQQADMVRQAGEERADAIRNSQLDADQLSEQQKKELIRGKTGTAAPGPR
jgi:uncharacterized protein YbjQ (UPF0145 family)